MSNFSEIIDMFADLQKNIHREIGTLMGQMLAKCAEPTKAPAPVTTKPSEAVAAPAQAVDIDAIIERQNAVTGKIVADLESRIMNAIERRLAALQTPIRRQSVSSNEEAPVPPPAPTKGQTTLSGFVTEAPVRKLDLTGIVHNSIKNEIVVVNKVEVEESVVVEEKEEEEAEVAEEEAEEEEEVAEEEDTSPDDSVVAEEEEEEEEGEEELTEFMYKGTKYFMDSECNVYGLNAEGELNEEPVGIYNITTRRITFITA